MTRLDDAPGPVPYLSADPAAAAACRERVRAGAERVVGVAWRGNATYAGDRIRSVPAKLLSPLSGVPGVRIVSLQKEATADECESAGAADIGAARWVDFAEAAAAVASVDMVVSEDPAVAHLAGALGVPVWIALPAAPDWRWRLSRGDSPWYPSARLVRQEARGEWEPVFQRIAEGGGGEMLRRGIPSYPGGIVARAVNTG